MKQSASKILDTPLTATTDHQKVAENLREDLYRFLEPLLYLLV
jgi:hypothetical protein